MLCLSPIIMGNDTAKVYLPDSLGSSWVYVDQDGNEFTRYAVEEKAIDGDIFRAFNYEPAIEDWEEYKYHIHPFLYQVAEEWVAFYVGKEIENTTKTVLGKRLEEIIAELRQQTAIKLPSGITIDFQHTVKPKAKDFFYLLPTKVTLNQEWIAMQLDVNLKITMDIKGAPVDVSNELKTISSTINVVEKGSIIGKENVKTEAGTFKDCLKIEYRSITTTKTTAASQIKQLLPEQKPNETTTTLWLAPNVGIVKFTSEKEQSEEKTVYKLKSYEIKSDESDISDSN